MDELNEFQEKFAKFMTDGQDLIRHGMDTLAGADPQSTKYLLMKSKLKHWAQTLSILNLDGLDVEGISNASNSPGAPIQSPFCDAAPTAAAQPVFSSAPQGCISPLVDGSHGFAVKQSQHQYLQHAASAQSFQQDTAVATVRGTVSASATNLDFSGPMPMRSVRQSRAASPTPCAPPGAKPAAHADPIREESQVASAQSDPMESFKAGLSEIVRKISLKSGQQSPLLANGGTPPDPEQSDKESDAEADIRQFLDCLELEDDETNTNSDWSLNGASMVVESSRGSNPNGSGRQAAGGSDDFDQYFQLSDDKLERGKHHLAQYAAEQRSPSLPRAEGFLRRRSSSRSIPDISGLAAQDSLREPRVVPQNPDAKQSNACGFKVKSVVGTTSAGRTNVLMESTISIPSILNARLATDKTEPRQLAWKISVNWPFWARKTIGLPALDSAVDNWCFICPSVLPAVQMPPLRPAAAARDVLTHLVSPEHRNNVVKREAELKKEQNCAGRFLLEDAKVKETLGVNLFLAVSPIPIYPRAEAVDYVIMYRGSGRGADILMDACRLKLTNKSNVDRLFVRLESSCCNQRSSVGTYFIRSAGGDHTYHGVEKELLSRPDFTLEPGGRRELFIDIDSPSGKPINLTVALFFLVLPLKAGTTPVQEGGLPMAYPKTVVIDFTPKIVNGVASAKR